MLLIAHRGASARAPENSLAAFERALSDGCDGIETDLRLTADGRLVLMHDDDASRTTSGTGRISEMDFAAVRMLDAGDGRPVPALEELLTLAAGRTRLYLEIKGSFGPGGFRSAAPVARALAPLIIGVPLVTVSSFDPTGVATMREIAPGVPTGLGTVPSFDPDQALTAALQGGHEEVHVPDAAVSDALVARARASGARMLVFTVNDPARLRALERWGVDGVFTDDPASARAALRR